MTQTAELYFFTARKTEHDTVFTLQVHLFRQAPDTVIAVLCAKHLDRVPHLYELIEFLRGPRCRTMKTLKFTLPHSQTMMCRPMDDADLLAALYHHEQRRKQRSTFVT